MRCLVPAAAAILVAGTAVGAFAVDKEVAKNARSGDRDDRLDAVKPLAKEGSKAAVKLLARLLVDEDAWVRDRTVFWMKEIKEPAHLAPIHKIAKSRKPNQRIAVAEALGRTGLPQAIPTLGTLSGDDDIEVRLAALHFLESFKGDAAAHEIATNAAADADPSVRAFGLWTCGVLDAPGARTLLEAALSDEDDRVRSVALLRLAWIDAAAAARRGVAMAKDPSARVRATCVSVARAARTPEAVDALIELIADDDLRTSSLAHRTLRGLSNKYFQRDVFLWSSWWKEARKDWKPPKEIVTRKARDATVDTPAEIFGAHLTSNALTIVLDASGDLAVRLRGDAQRTRWDDVVEEVTKAIGNLPDGTLLNVVVMNEKVTTAFPKPMPLDRAKRRKLRTFLERVHAMEGCDFWGGLRAGLDQPGVDTVVVVAFGLCHEGDFVLSDRVERAAFRRVLVSRQVLHTVLLGTKDRNKRAGNLMWGLATNTLGRSRVRTYK